MTVQRNVLPLHPQDEPAGTCPHPVSLETIELIEQALGDMLRSLRRKAGSHPAEDAGAVEYASWLPLIR